MLYHTDDMALYVYDSSQKFLSCKEECRWLQREEAAPQDVIAKLNGASMAPSLYVIYDILAITPSPVYMTRNNVGSMLAEIRSVNKYSSWTIDPMHPMIARSLFARACAEQQNAQQSFLVNYKQGARALYAFVNSMPNRMVLAGAAAEEVLRTRVVPTATSVFDVLRTDLESLWDNWQNSDGNDGNDDGNGPPPDDSDDPDGPPDDPPFGDDLPPANEVPEVRKLEESREADLALGVTSVKASLTANILASVFSGKAFGSSITNETHLPEASVYGWNYRKAERAELVYFEGMAHPYYLAPQLFGQIADQMLEFEFVPPDWHVPNVCDQFHLKTRPSLEDVHNITDKGVLFAYYFVGLPYYKPVPGLFHDVFVACARVGQKRKFDPDRAFAKRLLGALLVTEVHFDRILKPFCVHLEPLNMNDGLEQFKQEIENMNPRSRQRRKYDRIRMLLSGAHPEADRMAITQVKSDEILFAPKARNLTNVGSGEFWKYLRHIRWLSSCCAKRQVWFTTSDCTVTFQCASEFDSDQKSLWMEQVLARHKRFDNHAFEILLAGDDATIVFTYAHHDPIFVEFDVSRNDQSHTIHSFKFFEHMVTMLGLSVGDDDFIFTVRSAMKMESIHFRSREQLFTGKVWTTMYNSLSLGGIFVALFSESVAKGVPVTPEWMTEAWSHMGFDTKIRFSKDLCGITFNKGFWTCVQNVITWIPLPSRIFKFGHMDEADYSGPISLVTRCREVALGWTGTVLDPLFGTWVQKHLDKDTTKWRLPRGMNHTPTGVVLTASVTEVLPLYQCRYGIEEHELRSCIKYLEDTQDFYFGKVSHPVLMKIAQVDLL
jgi:hypothetical protein